MRAKDWAIIVAFSVISTALAASGQTTVLYQGSTDASPTSRGWLTYQYNPLETAPQVTSTTGAGGQTTFDSTSDSATTPDPDDDEEGGWSNYSYNPILETSSMVNSSFPSMNPATGFSVSWDLAITSESNTSTDRAGFDVIVLGSDKKGVELGYWGNDVWAQTYNSGFERDGTQDSNIQNDDTFDTGPGIIDYTLTVLGGNYTLQANGSTILTGTTHDYTASDMLPYTLPNFVFMGDDTSEASAKAEFSSLTVSVPEPVTAIGFAAIGAFSLLRRRPRR